MLNQKILCCGTRDERTSLEQKFNTSAFKQMMDVSFWFNSCVNIRFDIIQGLHGGNIMFDWLVFIIINFVGLVEMFPYGLFNQTNPSLSDWFSFSSFTSLATNTRYFMVCFHQFSNRIRYVHQVLYYGLTGISAYRLSL